MSIKIYGVDALKTAPTLQMNHCVKPEILSTKRYHVRIHVLACAMMLKGNYLWSRIYIAVASFLFVYKTVLPVAANVWKSGQGVCPFTLLIGHKEMRFCPVKKRRDISLWKLSVCSSV
jgi:hypothetical protein